MTIDTHNPAHASNATPEPWASVPLIFVPAIACPVCRSERPIIVRTQSENDGSRTRRCICRVCNGRFLVVIEPPE